AGSIAKTAVETEPPGFGGLRRTGWVLMLLLIAAGSLVAWRWRSAFDPAAATGLILSTPAAPFVFLAFHVVASLLFVPRTLLAIVAGLAFGMWWGVLWAVAGSVLGATAGFLIARRVNTGLFDRANWARFDSLLQ